MKSWQDFEYITLAIVPMFLFSATFFPLSVYPQAIQWVIQVLPLWHAVELMRALAVGVVTWGTAGHILYFVAMSAVWIWFTSRRLGALFLR